MYRVYPDEQKTYMMNRMSLHITWTLTFLFHMKSADFGNHVVYFFCACLSKPLMFCLDLNIFNIYQPQCYNDLCDKPPDFSIIIWITSNTSDGLSMCGKMCKFMKNISKAAEIYVFISEEKPRIFDGKTSNTQRPWKLSKSWYTGCEKLY